MKIAVLSGKGGTGKTFVSVNLACVIENALYVDCDVEEPDGRLFLKPAVSKTQNIDVTVPEVDPALCTGCQTCVRFCRYNALAFTGGSLMVFETVCHNCGGCVLFCPQKALHEKRRTIGTVACGASEGTKVLTGCLNPGEVSGVPIVRTLMELSREKQNVVADCPPGSGCLVMESIREADYCVLVAEPTLFGAHNLQMVRTLTARLGKPCGAVLNKCLPGDNPSETYCRENGVAILEKIPYDAEVARRNAEGRIAAREDPRWRVLFSRLYEKIAGEAAR